jgi:hypothetical protein
MATASQTFVPSPLPKNKIQNNRYLCRSCTSSFDVSVEQQLSSAPEGQTDSTRKDKQNAIHGHRQATKDSEKEGALPDPQLMADMNKFNEAS